MFFKKFKMIGWKIERFMYKWIFVYIYVRSTGIFFVIYYVLGII